MTQAQESFATFAAAAVDDMLAHQPTMATSLGDHRFDDRLDDLRPGAVDEETRALSARLRELDDVDLAALPIACQVDAQVLSVRLRERLFALTQLREHTQRYWLRYAARHYAERGRTDDWLGALELMLEQDPPLAEIVDAGLRDAYIAAGEELRGAMVIAGIAERHPPDSPHRRWADRELRVLLGEYRDQHVRRGPPPQRAENAELLLNFLEIKAPLRAG